MDRTIKNLVGILEYSDAIVTKIGVYPIPSASNYECEIGEYGHRIYPQHKISSLHFYAQFDTKKARYERCRTIIKG